MIQQEEESIETILHKSLSKYIGKKFTEQKTEINTQTLEDKTVCVVKVEPSEEPIHLNEDQFFVRENSTTNQLNKRDEEKYIKKHF